MTMFSFIRQHFRLALFGLVMAFGSSFGQTFFLSLFNPNLEQAFDISEGQLGALYSIATLASGFTLIWLGGKIDQVPIKTFSLWVCGLGVLACLSMAWNPHVALLALSFFLLRLSGQGLFTHIAMTSMAKSFSHLRGKALSVAAVGFPLGEAVFPVVAISLIAWVGWRLTWLVMALFLVLLVMPLITWCLSEKRSNPSEENPSTPLSHSTARSWTRRQVVRDPYFYGLLPAVIAPAMILTGMFFYQASLAQSKDWSLAWMASGFTFFALFHSLGAFFSGPSIDKFGVAKHLPASNMVLMLALLSLQFSNHPWILWVYLSLAGLTNGLSRTIAAALWAELYGVLHLGRIKALVGAIIVLSTAVAPLGFGMLLDHGYSISFVISLLCSYLVGAIILAVFALRAKNHQEGMLTQQHENLS